MKKFRVYGVMSATVLLSEYEADTEDEAINMAANDDSADYYPGLCHQCSEEIELGDIQKEEAEEVK